MSSSGGAGSGGYGDTGYGDTGHGGGYGGTGYGAAGHDGGGYAGYGAPGPYAPEGYPGGGGEEPRRSSGQRTLGLVTLIIGLVLAGLAIFWGATSLASLLWLRTEDKVLVTEFTSERTAVVVDNECGGIDLVDGAPGVVRTEAEIRWTFSKPTVSSESRDGVVRVEVDCPSFSFGVGQSTRVTVAVPPDAPVQAGSSAGSVEVTGLTGPLDLSTSAGSITGERLGSAEVDADTSAGSVTLSFAQPPEQVRATTSAGSVRVLVPDDDTAYRVDASTTAGSETVAVRTDPDSERTIVVRSSAGSVEVAYRG